jgi:short-subunit dehydrogenase
MPAPTRSLYCASKAASLLLYQSLIVEHPQIQFSIVIPGTVAGNFRVSSIDRGTELDVAEEKKGGLTPNQVASECVSAVDKRKKYVWLPWYYRLGHLIYWIWPGLIEKQSRKKYRYTVPLLDQLMT